MKKALILVFDGFEEIEAITIIDVLRRAGISVDTVGITGIQVTGSHNVRMMLDKKLLDIDPDQYDALIIPGGPGATGLSRSAKLMEIITKMYNSNKLVAAICAAPAVFAKAGILDNKKATIYPGMERELPYPRDERVVVDENVITSQGPGTAMEFALAIVRTLAGADAVVRLKEDMVI
jgi:4-methyl-5(b-hydroxyethyl)-thiazole monophosphate biosynthesis